VSPELYEAMQVLSNAAAKDIEPDLAEREFGSTMPEIC
jgi:hypothetical protein